MASVYHYDGREVGQTIREVLDRCEKDRPGFVLFTECFGHACAQIHDLWPMLQKIGLPVVAVWHDWAKGNRRDLEGVALNVIVDMFVPRDMPRNGLCLWTPHNEDRFYPSDNRDIGAIFVSSKYYKPIPGQWIEIARSRGSDILWTGGRLEDKLTLEMVADLYRRSKIALNFSIDSNGFIHQLKGRTTEVLASGCLLMENRNPHSSVMLEDGVEYVAFDSPEDMSEKINYYLNHDSERNQIAGAGYQRYLLDYSSDCWWRRVLQATGLLPEQLYKSG